MPAMNDDRPTSRIDIVRGGEPAVDHPVEKTEKTDL